MVSEYERQRDLNVERNKQLLISLGLDNPLIEPKEVLRKKTKPLAKKRKREVENDENGDEQKSPQSTAEQAIEMPTDGSGARRSARNMGRKIDYTSEQQRREPLPSKYSSGVKIMENMGPLGREGDSMRIHNPKRFGAIPGIEVGTWWESRKGCSCDSIHAPWVSGIHGGDGGAYSVALSGGYDDDVDLGYAFTYTGSGGRDLRGTKDAPKNLRTAPQSSDQDFENKNNRALKRSSETGKPVRVIRGFKLRSPYAPSEGYRYDGLYKVEKAWSERGLNSKGYLVCKFAFKRLPGQPPLPKRDEEGLVDVVDQVDDDTDQINDVESGATD